MKRTELKDFIGVVLLTLGNILMVVSVYERYAHGDHHYGSMVLGAFMVGMVIIYANIGKEQR